MHWILTIKNRTREEKYIVHIECLVDRGWLYVHLIRACNRVRRSIAFVSLIANARVQEERRKIHMYIGFRRLLWRIQYREWFHRHIF